MFSNLKNLIRNPKNKNGVKKQVEEEEKEPTGLLNIIPITKTDNNNDKNTELPIFKELTPRYTIIKKLGEGAFSKVYKAIDNELNVEVAIKIIEKDSLSSSQLNSIMKEISIMRRLDHPNVIKLYNYINTDNRAFIVMEFISGGELFNQIVKYTYFSEDLSRYIIIQVVKAVDYLHSEVGVVHRDIKPENLLFEKINYIPNDDATKSKRISDDNTKLDEGKFIENYGGGMVGKIKLADFGLSKILWDSNTKTPCGTASYTAPEIVKDESYSKSVDMWAIGCVLYTLLCGFPPFYDTDPKLLTLKVSKGEYTFLSPWWDEISKEAKDLVSHLLTVDPKKRYGPDDVLNHPWILNNSKPTNPASDAPGYRTRSDSVLTFEDTIPTVQNSSFLSPRAEAMKFAFDNGINIQRTGTPLRRLLEEDNYFNESDEDNEDDDSLDELDSDDDEDDELDSDDDEDDDDDSCYNHEPLSTHSPIVKKFNNFKINELPVTPHHFHRSGRNSSISSNNRNNNNNIAYQNKHKSSISSQDTLNSSHNNIPHPISPTNLTLATKTISTTSTTESNSEKHVNIGIKRGSETSSASVSSSFKFREIDNDNFNLRMDDNTLLNRRKIRGGSIGCGPAVTSANKLMI